ncbi:MAG: hypothetical protein ACJA0V_002624 [Planctomycetota bacterium]|jgi:hypothetical protein
MPATPQDHQHSGKKALREYQESHSRVRAATELELTNQQL